MTYAGNRRKNDDILTPNTKDIRSNLFDFYLEFSLCSRGNNIPYTKRLKDYAMDDLSIYIILGGNVPSNPSNFYLTLKLRLGMRARIENFMVLLQKSLRNVNDSNLLYQRKGRAAVTGASETRKEVVEKP